MEKGLWRKEWDQSSAIGAGRASDRSGYNSSIDPHGPPGSPPRARFSAHDPKSAFPWLVFGQAEEQARGVGRPGQESAPFGPRDFSRIGAHPSLE